MQDNRFSCGSGIGKETVCIETNRILDSCRDRDCFENVKVFLTDFGQEIIDHTGTVRVKSACITQTHISLDPVQFNKGFYTVNIRFYIKLELEACIGNGRSQDFSGIAVLDKKVILYGGESNVSIFKSNPDASDYCAIPEPCCSAKSVPLAIVEVVDPIILNSKVREHEDSCCCCCCCCDDIPEAVAARVGGRLADGEGRYLTVSLGIFSVVRIVRPAQYLIHATEYCVPDKECVSPENDDPCALFRNMAFPTAEFCPPEYIPPKSDIGGKCNC